MPSSKSFSGAVLVDSIQQFMDNMEAKYRRAFLALIESLTKSPELIALIQEINSGTNLSISSTVYQAIEDITIDTTTLRNLSRQAMSGGGRVTAKAVGLEGRFDLTNPRAIQYARSVSSNLVTGITKTVRENLREIIGDAVEGNEGIPETVRRIKTEVGLTPKYSAAVRNYRKQLIANGRSAKDANKLAQKYAEKLLKQRAQTIARTEIAQATNFGQHEFWRQMKDAGSIPNDTMRVWITAKDEKTCAICGPMNGQTTTIDGSWMTGNGPLEEPHAHPNCRCTSGLVFTTKLKKIDPLGYEHWIILKHGQHDQKTHGRRGVNGGRKSIIGPENVEMLVATPIAKLKSRHKVDIDWQKVVAVSPEKREQVAKAYTNMPDTDFSNPDVKKAWDDTEKEIRQQFKKLTEDDGISVEFVDEDPYTNFHDMHEQVTRTGVLKVLKTEVTGGHPYWSNETNDMFRAVHDAYGHLGTGRGFDRHGEEAAYQAHRSMFGETSQQALATELRGQNQFLIQNGFFGEQKIGFLPLELQKRYHLPFNTINKNGKIITSDDDNAYKLGGSHHVTGGRNFVSIRNLKKDDTVAKHYGGGHDQKTHGRRGGRLGIVDNSKIPKGKFKGSKRIKSKMRLVGEDGSYYDYIDWDDTEYHPVQQMLDMAAEHLPLEDGAEIILDADLDSIDVELLAESLDAFQAVSEMFPGIKTGNITFAKMGGMTGGSANAISSSIDINILSVQKGINADYFLSSYENGANTGWSVQTDVSPTQKTVVHEFGHVVRYRIMTAATQQLIDVENDTLAVMDPSFRRNIKSVMPPTPWNFNLSSVYRTTTPFGSANSDDSYLYDTRLSSTPSQPKNWSKHKQTVAREVSQYANTNGHELFAELFSEAYTNDYGNLRPSAKAFYDSFEANWSKIVASL